jgi:hypothetical protein
VILSLYETVSSKLEIVHNFQTTADIFLMAYVFKAGFSMVIENSLKSKTNKKRRSTVQKSGLSKLKKEVVFHSATWCEKLWKA